MGQTLDRETYRSIKRMNRDEMMAFLERYGNQLREDDGKVIDLSELEKELSKISGIGQKRLDEIMAVIGKFLNA